MTILKDIGGEFQEFKKGYEEIYGKDTRDIDTIVNTLLYDESNCVAKHWRTISGLQKRL